MRTSLSRLLCWLWLAPLALLASSCATSKTYTQNIMLRTENSTSVDTVRLRKALSQITSNYVIRPNDYIQVRVYTNKGERLVDPNGELRFGVPGNQSVATGSSQSGGGGATATLRGGDLGSRPAGDSEFLVQSDGQAKLPLVGTVRLSGYTLLQADSLLQLQYNTYYKDAFVATRVTNSRIFVLGSPGGRVVPLYNDNMNLLEVLASVGGIDGTGGGGGIRYGKAFNIRLIRGDLKNPMVQVIDLSTIDGMRRADLRMQPNDVVYIEPVRRPFREALTDVLPIVQAVTTLVTTVLLIVKL